jgi:hypothetical protein
MIEKAHQLLGNDQVFAAPHAWNARTLTLRRGRKRAPPAILVCLRLVLNHSVIHAGWSS